MKSNYKEIKNEIIAKRNQLIKIGIKSLPPKIHGDYTEDLIRDIIHNNINSQLYGVKKGIVYDSKENTSKECDIIIYRKKSVPSFEPSNLVVVNEEDVAFVVEVKSTLDSTRMKEAINNFKEVKKLNSHIMCWIVAFETKMRIKTLYRKAWKSKRVQFLQVFQSRLSTRTREKESLLLEKQMKFFIDAIRKIGNWDGYGKEYSWTDDFVICREGNKRIALTEDKEKSEKILSEIESTKFWASFEKGEIGDTPFDRPHN